MLLGGYLAWISINAALRPLANSTLGSRLLAALPIPAMLMYAGYRWSRGEVIGGGPERNFSTAGTFIDPTDPLWVRAVARARDTLPTLRELHQAREDCGVKFAFQTDGGTNEHVWGELVEIGETSFRATIETPPIGHRGPLPKVVELPFDALEDWIVQYPDGRIRGGFTTLAEIMIRERDGLPLPPHVAGFKSHLIDAVPDV